MIAEKQCAIFLEVLRTILWRAMDELRFFLEKLLKLVEGQDSKEVFSVLQSNTDKLDQNFTSLISRRINQYLSVNPITEDIKNDILSICLLCNYIQALPVGSQGDNIEIAISGYRNCLRLFSQATFPHEWAHINIHLANAHLQRLGGGRKENIEYAIKCFHKALDVVTVTDDSIAWATIQNNLGLAYIDRVSGDYAENIETALRHFQNALKVRKYNEFPFEWATTQRNIAIAYLYRKRGNWRRNVESSITCCENALKVFTFSFYPYEWAATCINLALAHKEYLFERRVEHLEEAVRCLQKAASVFTIHTYPVDWAKVQSNLAATYFDLQRHYHFNTRKQSEYIELAIGKYTKVLQIFDYQNTPLLWAGIQTNLGTSFADRLVGSSDENLGKAVNCYLNALKVHIPREHPIEYTKTSFLLGNVYEKLEKLHLAFEVYKSAIDTVESLRDQITSGQAVKKKHAEDWTLLYQHMIELCYRLSKESAVYQRFALEYVERNKARNLVELIAIREIYPKEHVPKNLFDEYSLLRRKLMSQQRLLDRVYHVESNLSDVNISYEEHKSDKLDKSDINPLSPGKERSYKINMQTKVEFGSDSFSGERIPQGQTVKTPTEVVPALLDLLMYGWRSKPSTGKHYGGIGYTDVLYDSNNATIKQLSAELKKHSRDLNQVLTKIEKFDPGFVLSQKVQPIPFQQIKSLVNDTTAIVEWYITEQYIYTFIIRNDKDFPDVLRSSSEEHAELISATNHYLKAYRSNRSGKGEWKNHLLNYLSQVSRILRIDFIQAQIPLDCSQLILVPHRYLHLWPLHALPIDSEIKTKPRLLVDRFEKGIRYGPSSQLLRLCEDHKCNDEFYNLIAVENPNQDLTFASFQVQEISRLFRESKLLKGALASKKFFTDEAFRKNFEGTHCLHFACHASFDEKFALESYIELAYKERLTLGEVFELDLRQCRLGVLSACETGVVDVLSISDEYIGLPSGFLFAGIPTLVSSLWEVDQVPTAFLMIKFFEYLEYADLQEPGAVANALCNAQKWLRELSCDEYEEILASNKALSKGQQKIAETYLIKARLDQQLPFSNPYNWAAFEAVGY